MARGIREQRPCPGGDLGGRGAAVLSLECACPWRGSILSLLACSPTRQSFRPKIGAASWLVHWEHRGGWDIEKLGGRSPRMVELGSPVGRTQSHPVNLSHSTFCQVAPSSLTSKDRKDPPGLCESSERNSIVFQEVFWGAITDSAGILRNAPSRRQLSAEGVTCSWARLEGGRLTVPGHSIGSLFLICFLLWCL